MDVSTRSDAGHANSSIIRAVVRASLALLALLAMACGDTAPKTGIRPLRIAVIPKGTTHEFWKSIHAGALQAARETGVEILWKGPPKEDDRAAQQKVVEDFITAKVDGIVLAPLDEVALAPVVTEAGQAGIPVVIIDSAIRNATHVSFVASDNVAGGALAAERLGALLGGKGRVIVLRHKEGHASTTDRERGFLDAMKAKHPGVAIVSDNQYGGPTSATSQTVAENLLTRMRGQFDGVFASNESATFGMLLALQSAGLAGSAKFVGFDASDKLVEALRKDEIHALVVQNPVRMGRDGVLAAVAALRKEPVQARIDTGVTLATKETMNDPAVKALLSPDLPASVR